MTFQEPHFQPATRSHFLKKAAAFPFPAYLAIPISDFRYPAIMGSRTKVVVTRRLIDEAQQLLEADGSLDIIQWPSDQVRSVFLHFVIYAKLIFLLSRASDPGSLKMPKAHRGFSLCSQTNATKSYYKPQETN